MDDDELQFATNPSLRSTRENKPVQLDILTPQGSERSFGSLRSNKTLIESPISIPVVIRDEPIYNTQQQTILSELRKDLVSSKPLYGNVNSSLMVGQRKDYSSRMNRKDKPKIDIQKRKWEIQQEWKRLKLNDKDLQIPPFEDNDIEWQEKALLTYKKNIPSRKKISTMVAFICAAHHILTFVIRYIGLPLPANFGDTQSILTENCYDLIEEMFPNGIGIDSITQLPPYVKLLVIMIAPYPIAIGMSWFNIEPEQIHGTIINLSTVVHDYKGLGAGDGILGQVINAFSDGTITNLAGLASVLFSGNNTEEDVLDFNSPEEVEEKVDDKDVLGED